MGEIGRFWVRWEDLNMVLGFGSEERYYWIDFGCLDSECVYEVLKA